jgi:hypothetical protein
MSIHHSDAIRKPTVESRADEIFRQIVDDDSKLLLISDLYLDYRLNRLNLPEER